MTVLMFGADVIRAPGCPHYISRSRYDQQYMVLGPDGVAAIRCEHCLVHGRVGVERHPRVSLRRDGLTVTERDRFLARRLT